MKNAKKKIGLALLALSFGLMGLGSVLDRKSVV